MPSQRKMIARELRPSIRESTTASVVPILQSWKTVTAHGEARRAHKRKHESQRAEIAECVDHIHARIFAACASDAGKKRHAPWLGLADILDCHA